MDEMLIRDIRVGQVFDRAVFTPRGLMIVPPGVPIGPALLARLRNLRRGVILLGNPDEILRRGRTVSAASLASPTAQTLAAQTAASATATKQTSVVNSGGAMDLQVRAEEETERGARRAMQRAWEFERSRLRQRASLRRSAEELVQAMAARWERLPRRVSAPGMTGDVGGGVEGDSRSPNVLEPSLLRQDDFGAPLALELATERADRVGILQRFWDRLLNAERVRSAVLVELVDELIDLMLRHSDRFAAIALGARRVNESVAEHAYATGALSVAIATRLGWEISDIRNAGLAGIMADSGMLLLATDVRDLARPLTEVEWNAMRRHPAYSLALVSHVLDLPEIIGLAVYQHHEREDGSGYPVRARSGNSGSGGGGAAGNERGVCDLARVVAVADVLAGASAARVYRSKLTPHGAVQLVVRQAASGQLDRQVVRAAVRAVGVFPTGSYVRLNTGEFGIVEAVRDPERADRPLVRLVEAMIASGSHGFLEPKPEVIDLAASEAQGISVIEALHLPGERELAMTA